ncbi:MAG TPA: hypothetical protein VK150_09790 [Geothrix sp.]|nr:hypothetical protein [Geothrix sp.]
MVHFLLVLPALVSAPKPNIGAPVELKGVRMGMTMDEVVAAINARNETFQPETERKGATAEFTEFGLPIAGVESPYVTYDFVEISGTLRLARIIAYFDASSFASIQTGFLQKYGLPSSKVEPFHTKGGLKTTSRVCTWKRLDGTIILTERKFKLDQGRLDLVSPVLWRSYMAEWSKWSDKQSSDI